MFGLLNVLFLPLRPLGGIVAYVIYKYTESDWDKLWLTFLDLVLGGFALIIGFLDPKIKAKDVRPHYRICIFHETMKWPDFCSCASCSPFCEWYADLRLPLFFAVSKSIRPSFFLIKQPPHLAMNPPYFKII